LNNPLKKLIRLRPEEGRTINSITTEYNISKETLRRWCNEFKEECQTQSLQFPNSVNEAEIMKENLRLRKEPAEKEKVILFLKKRRHSSQRKSIRGLSVYRPTS
jgi:transposase